MLKSLAKIFSKPEKTEVPEFQVVEGIHGTWFYHLARTQQPRLRALCSDEKPVMHTSAPLSSWGYKSGHLNERYCAECERLARESGIQGLGRA
jgi:hypothetical protein